MRVIQSFNFIFSECFLYKLIIVVLSSLMVFMDQSPTVLLEFISNLLALFQVTLINFVKNLGCCVENHKFIQT